ncbi:hypothetical protein RISK_002765 [Rhodopirellula islandica]|uniref:Uncharacterized protein n=1 Tax=Rhodopirellula islandica TaxID=595434 RepID=A0A0J1EI17_RHOIS|nr:hypothetical protein [Rhodopirellula islandica]KLU05189.1 hypothetical protein RISK_002765 [Rhodopirellula islandica]
MPTFHSIVWDFGVPEITDLQMDVTVHNDPPGPPGPQGFQIGTVYFQLYDFRIFADLPQFQKRGIYSYHGPQTNVFDANKRQWRGSGLLFSYFETSNPNDVQVAEGGWPEFPTPQQIQAEGGQFLGVRNSFHWGSGSYRFNLKPVAEDTDGIWYEFTGTDRVSGDSISCGSLRFPTINGRRPLIPNLGSTWIEITPHNLLLANCPFWHVTFDKVTANNGTLPAQTAAARYADDQAPARNSDISLNANSGAIDFRIGQGVVRRTPNGTILTL